MRFFALALLVVSVARAEEIPPTVDVLAYLKARTQAVCGKTPTNAGFLASQVRGVCQREHHHDHDWHACVDATVAVWCAGH